MKRRTVAVGVALGAAMAAPGQRRKPVAPSLQPPQARGEAEKRILDALAKMRAEGGTHLEVPDEDGRMLRVLAESAGARHVVEVGTSTGYSGLWFCLALERTGGKLTTFEADAPRAARAREHFEEAGVARLAAVIEGDAHRNVAQVQEPIDVLFLDADKEGYADYLNKLLPLVRAGGLILAHNIDLAPEYVRQVTSSPALETVFYMQGRSLGITLKKR